VTGRDPSAGVTLVEMLVSLALFALIGGAGFAVLDQVLRASRQTEAALAELGDLQRTMHLLAVDAALAEPGSLTLAPATGAVGLVRRVSGEALTVRYGVEGDVLVRALARPDGTEVARQALASGIAEAAWEGLDARGVWRPLSRIGPFPETPVRALALTLRLDRGDRRLRRVLPLLPGEGP
jgi:general secretion pathway protein J